MMERSPQKREDTIVRLRRKIDCLRKMYARKDPITSAFFPNGVPVSVMRSGINYLRAQGLERSAIAEAPPRPSASSYPVLKGLGEVSGALCGAGGDYIAPCASRNRKGSDEDTSSMLEARAQRPSVIQATPSLRDEFEVVEESAEPMRVGETIKDPAEGASKANEDSQMSESDRSHQEKTSAGERSNSIHPPGDISASGRAPKNRKLFACDACEKKFRCASELGTHQRIHTGEKPFSCDACDKRFTQAGYLTVHRRIHKGERPFTCDVCAKSFNQSENLKRHRRIHTGEKPFTCDVCDRRFSQLEHLKTHGRLHTGEKPFTCDVCAKSFNQLEHLRSHRRTHTGEKPFTCDVCDRRFSQLGTLKTHARLHTGEKPFTCDVCARSFNGLGNLKSHRRIHTGEKPFSCDLCEMKFRQAVNLKRHQGTHKSEKPFPEQPHRASTNSRRSTHHP